MLTYGLLGAITIRSRRRERLEHARRGPRASPSKRTASTSSRWPRADEPLLEGEAAGGRLEPGAQPVVGRGQDGRARRRARARGARVTPRAARPRAAPACARGGARGRGRRAGTSPRRRAPATVSSAFHVSSARPQPRSSSFRPGERVEDGVEVGRDVQAEHLDVVADVADDRHARRVDGLDEPAREAGAADAAGEERDLHRGDDRRERGLRARPDPQRQPLEIVERVDVVGEVRDRRGDGVATPFARACARKRAALPGP